MGSDVFKPRGKLKKNAPGAGVASVIQVPIICTVMSTVDPTFQGQIAVYPSENMAKDAYDTENWIYVNRLAGFAGQTEGISSDDDYGKYTGNPSSYGQWNAPPDKLTKVICIFVNGDPNYGFYIGSAPDPETLSMIPAIGSSDNVTLNEGEAASYAGAPRLPTTNINVNNPAIKDSASYLADAKPVHSYTASIMQQQGILRDKYRGPISTSATREASSRVGWGVSTPGRPIYQGGLTDADIASKLDLSPENYRVVTRRGGHSLVMDDGDIIGRDQLIRLRTALGHQILMSDDGQMLSILHSNGQSYIELGKEGTIDVFSTNSVNIRTQGDLNLHADNDLNLSAKNVNINSTENTTLNADKEFSQRVGGDYSLYTLQNLKMKADAALAIEAAGQIGIKTAAEIFNEGSKIHLNDGAASLTPGVVEPIDVILHPDTLFDDTVGWAAALAKLPSITSRAPAHMPWMNANQGADVSVDSSAEASLPASPSTNVSALNAGLADAGGDTASVSPAAAAGISEVGAVSSALDKNTTSTLLSGVAGAAAGKFGSAVNAAGVTNAVAGAASDASSLTLGKFGQTPSQLSTGGVLKPGADTLVNTLFAGDTGGSKAIAAAGGIPKSILPTSAFTGKNGVSTAEQYASSGSAQAKGVVQTLQKGQKALQTIGAVTGKESPAGLGSVVSGTVSSVTGGSLGKNVAETSSLINKVAAGGVGAIAGGASAAAGGVLNSMKQGAESVAASALSGGLGGISKALDTISKADLPGIGNVLDVDIGPSASSFKAITASFGKLEANMPQDLTAIAGAAAAKVAGASAGMSSADLANPASITDALASTVGAGSVAGALSGATGALSGATSALTGGVSAITNKASSLSGAAVAGISGAVSDVNSVSGSVTALTKTDKLQSAATKVQRGATATISSTIASGVSGLPGGQKLGESVVNNAKGSVNAIADGLGGVTDGLSSLAVSAFEGTNVGSLVKDGKSLLGKVDKIGSITSGISSALSPGAAAALASALSSLTAGGGSTVKLPVVATNTYNRAPLTSLIDNVLGNPIIPRPNLLGEIPSEALSAVASLFETRKGLTADIKKLNEMTSSVAKKQRAFFEAQSSFPAGSPEIAQAEAAYQTAVSSPAYTALLSKVESAKESIGDDIPNIPLPSVATDPFSNIERAIENASSNKENQQITSENTGTAPERVEGFSTAYTTINPAEYNEDTYSNVIATTTATVVTQPKPVEVVDTNGDLTAPENTVEAIVTGVIQEIPGGAAGYQVGNGTNSGAGLSWRKWVYETGDWKLQ